MPRISSANSSPRPSRRNARSRPAAGIHGNRSIAVAPAKLAGSSGISHRAAKAVTAAAHHAVVVVNHRRNIDLLPHLTDHRSVWQVAPRGDPHPGLRVLDFAALHTLAQEDVPCR